MFVLLGAVLFRLGSGQAHDKLGIWDCLSKVDDQGKVFMVVVNATDFDQDYWKK